MKRKYYLIFTFFLVAVISMSYWKPEQAHQGVPFIKSQEEVYTPVDAYNNFIAICEPATGNNSYTSSAKILRHEHMNPVDKLSRNKLTNKENFRLEYIIEIYILNLLILAYLQPHLPKLRRLNI